MLIIAGFSTSYIELEHLPAHPEVQNIDLEQQAKFAERESGPQRDHPYRAIELCGSRPEGCGYGRRPP